MSASPRVGILGAGQLALMLAEAEVLCESVVCQIRGPFFHREDIGTAALIERRVEHMKSLRGE